MLNTLKAQAIHKDTNAVAVVLKATHAEKAYVKRLQFLCHVVECSVNARFLSD